MLILANLMALVIIVGVLIYTLNFARWLYKRKAYRGAVGVFMLGVLQLSLSLFSLLKSRFD